jgi:signal transduction histidine kinase
MATTTRSGDPKSPALNRTARLARELESLQVLIDSMGQDADLVSLLTRLLGVACELIGADHGAIGLVDRARNVVRTAAVRNMPPNELGAEMAPGVGLAGQVLATGKTVYARRYGDLPRPTQTKLVEHVVIGVPIRWGSELIGVFGLGRALQPARILRRSRRPLFAPRDIAALEEFARYAAIAIHNARRYADERRRAERLAVVARVARLITGDLRLDDLLDGAAQAIHELLGYENVAIAQIDEGTPDALFVRSFGGSYRRVLRGTYHVPFTQGLMGAAARNREIVLVNDVSIDPRYMPTPGVTGTHAELAVPILLGTDVLGVVNVEGAAPFYDDDAEALRIVADQLAVAIENARLYEAARRGAVLEERHRIARELHDSVTQQLFSATLIAQSVAPAFARDPVEGERRATMLLDLARTALAEMRGLLAELRPHGPGGDRPAMPPMTDPGLTTVRKGGLVAALRAHFLSAGVGELRVKLDADGYAPQPADREEALYRMIREALHNVVKHARASEAEVRLVCTSDVVRATVRDDGIGFASEGRTASGRFRAAHGLGLLSIRERAAEHHGAFRIESEPGRGTLVEITLPIANEGTP